MRRLLWAVFLGSLLSGCGTHYYRVDGDDVILILRKPEAKRVVLACSLDGFRSRSAQKLTGRWEVRLPAGDAFKYFYWVDDLLFLPDCPMQEDDDFGSKNCIFDPQL